jgi:hypothetical protein
VELSTVLGDFHTLHTLYTADFRFLRKPQTFENRPDEGEFRAIDSTFYSYSL